MSSPPDEGLPTVAKALLSYWQKNPDAVDSVQGIATWWLAGWPREISVAEVERALNMLVDRGLATRRKLADGTVVYARHA